MISNSATMDSQEESFFFRDLVFRPLDGTFNGLFTEGVFVAIFNLYV